MMIDCKQSAGDQRLAVPSIAKQAEAILYHHNTLLTWRLRMSAVCHCATVAIELDDLFHLENLCMAFAMMHPKIY